MKKDVATSQHRWPKHVAFFWEEAPFFRLLPPLALGILAYDRAWINLRNPLLLLGLLVAAAALFGLISLLKKQQPFLHATRFMALQFFLFLAGFALCHLRDDRNRPEWYGHTMNRAEAYLARISGYPQEKQNIWKQEVSLLRATDSTRQWAVSGRAYLNIYKNDSTSVFHYGDTVVIKAAWQTINNTGNPFEFDYVNFCARRNIYHQIFMSASSKNVVGHATQGGLSWLERGHNFCVGQLRHYLPDPAAFGLLQAMLMGDERDFDPELRQAYSDTGVVHIVSISGSHTAVLFVLITGLFFWLRAPRWQWVKYAVGVTIVWVYVLMAGAPPSALRSAVMFSVFAFGYMLGRQRHPLNTLLLAAFVLLCAEPFYLFAVGFQLSFVAVLSLILFYQPVTRLWPAAQSAPYVRKLWQIIAASFAAEVLTAPLVVFYFHNFPVLFIIANIASVVLVGIVALVGGLAILAFCWLPPFAGAVGWVVTGCIGGFNRLVVVLQQASPQAAKHLMLSGWELAFVYGAITFLGIAWLRRKRLALMPAMACLAALSALAGLHEYKALRQQKLIVYNANKHLLIEKISGKRHIVIQSDKDSGDHRMIDQAHDGFYAWRQRQEPAATALSFGNRNVALLTAPVDMGTLPQVQPDVLIVADSVQYFSLGLLNEAFSPKKFVVTGRQKRYLVQQWIDSAALLHIPLHATMVDGAFIME